MPVLHFVHWFPRPATRLQPLPLNDILMHSVYYIRRSLQKYYIRICELKICILVAGVTSVVCVCHNLDEPYSPPLPAIYSLPTLPSQYSSCPSLRLQGNLRIGRILWVLAAFVQHLLTQLALSSILHKQRSLGCHPRAL